MPSKNRGVCGCWVSAGSQGLMPAKHNLHDPALAQLSGLAHLRNALQKRGLGCSIRLVFMKLPHGQHTCTQAQHVRIPMTLARTLQQRPIDARKEDSHTRQRNKPGWAAAGTGMLGTGHIRKVFSTSGSSSTCSRSPEWTSLKNTVQ